MNQEKIGKFIFENRKLKNLTQSQLAEKLGVTDRTISNWENGKNMPDLSLFKPLCDIFGISINELMSGERIDSKEYNDKLEENFINTIDYIDKRNLKVSGKKSIYLLIISIVLVCLTQFLFNDFELENYVTVISMIIGVYSVKQLLIMYRISRRIIALILFFICILVLILK